MDQSTINLISSALAGAIPLLVALIAGITPNLVGRRVKGRQQELDLRFKRFEIIEKAVGVAKKLKDDLNIDIETAHLKREFELLLASENLRQRSSLESLNRYLSRSRLVSFLFFSFPYITEPRNEASSLRKFANVTFAYQLISVIVVLLSIIIGNKADKAFLLLNLPKTTLLYIALEFAIFGLFGIISVRSIARKAREKLLLELKDQA